LTLRSRVGQGEGVTFRDSQQTALDSIAKLEPVLSQFHLDIWANSEPAWREYRSAAAYVSFLRGEGFEVEAGSGGMPTAFHATWGETGPDIGLYAEYDATPGYTQDAVPHRAPRPGTHPWAPGFTDAHCALGTGALSGALALKQTLIQHRLPGRIHLFGEPAEKVCGSKAVHAAKGYYDQLDAAISFHPLPFTTVLKDVLNCLHWGVVFTFECDERDPWVTPPASGSPLPWGPHNSVRSPGALDALAMMITSAKAAKEQMFPQTGLWSVNEAVLGASFATADNLAQRISQIHYAIRSPLIDIQEQIVQVLQRVARHVAGMTNCRVSMRWVTKTRPGLKNHVMTSLMDQSLRELGPASFGPEAYEHGRELERQLGHQPSADPFIEMAHVITPPEEWDALQQAALPPWQQCVGADDYTEYTWHTPTVRFHTAKPTLKVEPGLEHWANNSMNGLPAAIDPSWVYAGQAIALTALDLIEEPAALAAVREEFLRRRDEADPRYQQPLLPADFTAPADLPWPQYVQTERGYEWCLPTTANFGDQL
jgi:aminobenzoyl-glutamate utilization protein B